MLISSRDQKEKMSAVPTSPVVLTYFNGRGRAELIRLMLEVTGTPFTERRITRPLLQELREKGDLLFQQLPLLEIEGMKLIQSGAIVRSARAGMCYNTCLHQVI